ncbi:hypothetical protein B0H13DRAFT_2554938 [Mycena leptocephala]|nr:hypothetical protein B0H13DRAFT_2554938 [Mycena leptocephala]
MPRAAPQRTNEPIYFDTPAALAHRAAGAIVALAVDEALCWGWIDGVKKSVDADRTMQRFTPRKAKSHWSKVNVAKVAALETAGRMQEPGRAAFALRTEENTGQMSFERDNIPLSAEFAARLAEASAAAEWHAEQPPGYRRTAEDWVMSAKQAATRERRFAGSLRGLAFIICWKTADIIYRMRGNDLVTFHLRKACTMRRKKYALKRPGPQRVD